MDILESGVVNGVANGFVHDEYSHGAIVIDGVIYAPVKKRKRDQHHKAQQ